MNLKLLSNLRLIGVAGILVPTVLFQTGCNGVPSLIQQVVFTPSSDLQTVSVALVFTNTVQSTMSGTFSVGEYGQLFIDPYSSVEPFEIGFTLDTSIFNDQNYVKLTATSTLPNGDPIGAGVTMVQIQGANPISSSFDLYGYVDVLTQSWLGAAAIFDFLDPQNFPTGLSLTQVFESDAQGHPEIIGSVFGPTASSTNTVAQAGGLAVFANIRELIAGKQLQAGQATKFYPKTVGALAQGAQAQKYSSLPAQAQLNDKLIHTFSLH